VTDAIPQLVFGLVLVAAGWFFWVFGVRLFSLQSRAFLGDETNYVRRTVESRWGRFTVSGFPALLSWICAAAVFIGTGIEWVESLN